MSYDDHVQVILHNLTTLIVLHANMCAREQYSPQQSADMSDDFIAARKQWIAELRAIRERFENLVTGIL